MSDTPGDSLKRLRGLRRTVRELNGTMATDLKPFLQTVAGNGVTFRRLPYTDLDDESSKDVGVTVTCTALMALATTGRLTDFYGDPNSAPKKSAQAAFAKILSAPWKSSGLKEANKFTQIIVLRTAGVLAHYASMQGMPDQKRDASEARTRLDHNKNIKEREEDYKKEAKELQQTEDRTLREIANDILDGKYEDGREAGAEERPAPESITLGKYSASAALAYWFIDAFGLLGEKLTPTQWITFARWASREFSHQVSLVTSSHDAMMDPISMAMAACLSARLREAAPSVATKEDALRLAEILPSAAELRNGLRLLMGKQQASGIWAKYFPMFQYLDDSGANYCFSFEMLEAILSEFANKEDEDEDIFSDNVLLCGLEKAVEWIKHNRLTYRFAQIPYRGWNSGGQIQTLGKGIPESWATGVVHMFLFKLEVALSTAIQARLLATYGANLTTQPDKKKWEGRVGPNLFLSGSNKSIPLKTILDGILGNWDISGHESELQTLESKVSDKETQEKIDILKNRMSNYDPEKRKRSALLFGPPGTSKTSLVKLLAGAHKGWPFVSINPSHFLRDGLERIFGRANEIFDDLMDLSRVVVFFDEMDPLVQKREAGSDIHHQSLTTVLLPKLADLYGRNKVVFFMATNHIQQIDPAIRRPGRFDYLLFVGPPRWGDKYKELTSKDHKSRDLLDDWSAKWIDARAAEERRPAEERNDVVDVVGILDRFTFDETRALLEDIEKTEGGKGGLFAGLFKIGQDGFRDKVVEWSRNYIVLWEKDDARADDYKEFIEDRRSSRG